MEERQQQSRYQENTGSSGETDALQPPKADSKQQHSSDLADLKALIKDCGISHTTLEEVFMKMTGKKQSKYVVREGGPLQEEPSLRQTRYKMKK